MIAFKRSPLVDLFRQWRGASPARRLPRLAPSVLGAVGLLAHGWIYSFVWTAAALLYLWLRHAVDGTPWTEIEPDEETLDGGKRRALICRGSQHRRFAEHLHRAFEQDAATEA